MTNIDNPQINPRELLELYLSQKFEQLSEKFIEVLEHFEKQTYLELEPDIQYFVDVFIKNFLYFFTQPEYILNDKHAIRFLQFNLTISNLVAISSFKTTDAHLKILINQSGNFAKLLALYSARNAVEIEYSLIFDAAPQLACLWYSCFCEIYRSGLVNKKVYQNLRKHITYTDDKLTTFYNIEDVYFGATYVDGEQDREIKQKINSSIKNSLLSAAAEVKNTFSSKKIAVFTALWFPEHSVHRTLLSLLSLWRTNTKLP